MIERKGFALHPLQDLVTISRNHTASVHLRGSLCPHLGPPAYGEPSRGNILPMTLAAHAWSLLLCGIEVQLAAPGLLFIQCEMLLSLSNIHQSQIWASEEN